MEPYSSRGSNAGEDSVSSVENVIAQSKHLRSRISDLSKGMAASPDLVRAGQIQVEVEALKPRLSRLAKSAVTDVKIRAGGEEHRLKDAQAALLALARDASRGVAGRLERGREEDRRVEAWDALSLLDDQLAGLRRHIFDEAANERQNLFL